MSAGCGTVGNRGYVAGGGLFDYSSIVEINTTKTITESSGTVFRVVDSGTPSDYTITLPSSPSDGDAYGFIFDGASTKMFTLSGNGNTLNGKKASYAFYAGESIFVCYDATLGYWVRLHGTDIPMKCSSYRNATITGITSGATQDLSCDVEFYDIGGIYDTTTFNVTTRRDNKAIMGAGVGIGPTGAGDSITRDLVQVNRNGAAIYRLFDLAASTSAGSAPSGGGDKRFDLTTGDVIDFTVTGVVSASTWKMFGFTGGIYYTHIYFEEVIEW